MEINHVISRLPLLFVVLFASFCVAESPTVSTAPYSRQQAVAEFQRWLYGCDRRPADAAVAAVANWVGTHPDDYEAIFWLAEAGHQHWVSTVTSEDQVTALLQKASDGHFPAAEAELGRRMIGDGAGGVPIDLAGGTNLLRLAMEAKEPSAFADYGYFLFMHTQGRKEKIDEAVSVLAQAVSLGFERSDWIFASALLQQGHNDAALAAVRRGAKVAEPRSCLLLAQWYRNGFLIARDDNEALRLANLAADAGDPEAMCVVGDLYTEGRGTAQDSTKAFEIYHRAAASGSDDAKFKVAQCYLAGTGTQVDLKVGREMMENLAEHRPDAMLELGIGYIEGLWIDRDLDKAYDVLKNAQAHGVDSADVYIRWLTLKRNADRHSNTGSGPSTPSLGTATRPAIERPTEGSLFDAKRSLKVVKDAAYGVATTEQRNHLEPAFSEAERSLDMLYSQARGPVDPDAIAARLKVITDRLFGEVLHELTVQQAGDMGRAILSAEKHKEN